MTPIPQIRIGLVGNPAHPDVPWSDETLKRLKAIGFNAVQLNLAWEGPSPTHEPGILADVATVPGERARPEVAEKSAELRNRIALAERHDLRLFFQIGSPPIQRNPYTGDILKGTYRIDDVTHDSWYDILNPKVRDQELALLQEFRRRFPEVTDLLVHTQDTGGWQTPEFQYTKYSYGVPLAKRLPGYLQALHDVWTKGREGKARLWWEPWQLSAGQVYAILPQVPRTDFGLFIHSNIHEVQLVRSADVWFRNTARMCRTFGIPVVAQAYFGSNSEDLEPLSIPAPRLVDEAYQTLSAVPGVVGIKEYFGVNGSAPDLNLDLLQARLGGATSSTAAVLSQITKRFGASQTDVCRYLGLLADALQTYPWDAAWTARCLGRASTDHGWRGATINGAAAPTPCFSSNHHAAFMKLDVAQPHFWMLEDVQLRCAVTAEILDEASEQAARFVSMLSTPQDRAYFEQIEKDVDVARRVVRSYALHIRETNVAEMLRQDLSAARPMTAALVKELGELLEADVANQGECGRVLEMRRLYRGDPEAFVRRYLIPVQDAPKAKELDSPDLPLTSGSAPEKGLFTLTTR